MNNKEIREELESLAGFYTWDTPYECGLIPFTKESTVLLMGSYYGKAITEENIETFLAGKPDPSQGKWAFIISASDGQHQKTFATMDEALKAMQKWLGREESCTEEETYFSNFGERVHVSQI